MNFKDKGNIGETAFLHAMVKEGIEISIPFGDNLPYDFIIRINKKCYTIQVKTGNYSEETNSFSCMLHTCYYDSKEKSYVKHYYDKDDVDFFAFYCIEKDILCIVPFSIIDTKVITISMNNKSESRQISNRWFYEDINYELIINKLKDNEEIENPLLLNESLSKYKTRYDEVPEELLQLNDSELIKAYKRAVKSESGFRGVTLNTHKNGVKWKSHFKQGEHWVYIGSSNDAKELAILHDKKGIELLGDKAITNAKLGLL